MQKLTRTEKEKLFLKSTLILKTAFLYVKVHYSSQNEKTLKNIIIIPKKCGIAVRRNYIRRITKYLICKYNLNKENQNYILIYKKENLNLINYKEIEENLSKLKKII